MRASIWLLAILSPAALAAPQKAYFAGGCFWCMEQAFEEVEGVSEVISGYLGGQIKNPTYEQVVQGNSGHIESIEVHYDDAKVSYETLLYHYWINVDPTVSNRQFCDRGPQYRSALFYQNEKQKSKIEASFEKVEKLFTKVHTEVLPYKTFYAAEGYHQDYYKKNPIRYKFYKYNCGRENRLNALWESRAPALRESHQSLMPE